MKPRIEHQRIRSHAEECSCAYCGCPLFFGETIVVVDEVREYCGMTCLDVDAKQRADARRLRYIAK